VAQPPLYAQAGLNFMFLHFKLLRQLLYLFCCIFLVGALRVRVSSNMSALQPIRVLIVFGMEIDWHVVLEAIYLVVV
jgi:hypothetical protein